MLLLLFYKRFYLLIFFIFQNFSFSIRDPIPDQIRDLVSDPIRSSPILILSTEEAVKFAERYLMKAQNA